MITVGVDAHKDTHTLCALDEAGRVVGYLTVPARRHGHAEAIAWARGLSAEHEQIHHRGVRWAVEDCRHVTGLLESDLLNTDAHLVRVPTIMTVRQRAAIRTPGKSDQIDARAIAQAAQRELLPRITRTADSEQIAVLREIARHREQLVRDRTVQLNRIIGALHRYDPDLTYGDLTTLKHTRVLRGTLRRRAAKPGLPALAAVLLANLIGDLSVLLDLTGRINTRTAAIRNHPLVKTSPLLKIIGCGPLTVAALLTTFEDITRYRSADAFAAAAGCTPIQASSGRSTALRLNRGGNRRLNTALHTIARYQSRHPSRGRDRYLALTTGQNNHPKKTDREAIRILKTGLARHIWRTLTKQDLT